jgi:hypothetical protein
VTKSKPMGRHRWVRREWDGFVSRYWDCTRCGEFVYDLNLPPRTTPRGFVRAVGKCGGADALMVRKIKQALAKVKPMADQFKSRPMRCQCPGWCVWHTPIAGAEP